MPIFRVPKTIRWIFFCGVIYLLLMGLYRLGIYSFFNYYTVQGGNLQLAFWNGFQFDARVIGGFSLFLFLLSCWPNVHFFKTAVGRNTALLFYFLFSIFMFVFYAADIVSLFVFKTRLNGSLVSDLAKNTSRGQLFIQDAPWVAILLGCVAITWLLVLVIKALHGVVNKKSMSSDSKIVRVFWQVTFTMLCGMGMYGGFRKQPITTQLVAQNSSAPLAQLALNPFESFFSTLPKLS